MIAPALIALAGLALAVGDEETPAKSATATAETQHTLKLAGGDLTYTARAGTLRLSDEDGTPRADVFHVSYELAQGRDDATRPVTFCFNGGPGSSSVWLHLGVFGPQRVELSDAGEPPLVPPYRCVPNESTLLDISDLVFVDPPSTGYSRVAEGTDAEAFHGVDEDVRWMAEFIRLFVTQEERWDSPKFLAGESYGTTRVAGLARRLQETHGMNLNGVVLISSILDFQTARFDVGNDLPYVLFLPTYTATAFYHGKLAGRLAKDLERTLDEAETFAAGDYRDALFAGERLGEEARLEIAHRLAAFTGLSVDFCLETNLRPKIHQVTKELLRERALTVGRLDSRFVGRDRRAAGERYEFDPSYAAIQGAFTGALNAYVREELDYANDLPYEILTGRVQPWSWTGRDQRYVALSESLRRAITTNPALDVFVANGRYDLATPYFATEYTFAHLELPPESAGNVELHDYPAGHMMYVHLPSLATLRADLGNFYARALRR
ncbi:MAG: peptidase S10 [Planctomycetota bacterium]